MKKILIVDDSAFMRNVLKDIIASNSEESAVENFDIYEADGKTKAISLARQIKPDVVLLDVVMQESELEGVEFIEEANDFYDLSKIIMISSIGHLDVINTCKNMGVKFYLQKPFSKSELIETIKQVTG